MMVTAKSIRQTSVDQLVVQGSCLQVFAFEPNAGRITELSRVGGNPGTPFFINPENGFTSVVYANADKVFRIEALTDEPVYYAVTVGGPVPGMIIEEGIVIEDGL